jgi:hypothetical protein
MRDGEKKKKKLTTHTQTCCKSCLTAKDQVAHSQKMSARLQTKALERINENKLQTIEPILIRMK